MKSITFGFFAAMGTIAGFFGSMLAIFEWPLAIIVGCVVGIGINNQVHHERIVILAALAVGLFIGGIPMWSIMTTAIFHTQIPMIVTPVIFAISAYLGVVYSEAKIRGVIKWKHGII